MPESAPASISGFCQELFFTRGDSLPRALAPLPSLPGNTMARRANRTPETIQNLDIRNSEKSFRSENTTARRPQAEATRPASQQKSATESPRNAPSAAGKHHGTMTLPRDLVTFTSLGLNLVRGSRYFSASSFSSCIDTAPCHAIPGPSGSTYCPLLCVARSESDLKM